MSKVQTDYAQFVPQLCHAFASGGALLASLDTTGKVNPMTIGWGSVGMVWGRQLCTVMVRPSRYTYACIEATSDFTVSLPYRSMRDAVDFCGTTSGRDYDKMAECSLTALPSETIKTPGISECGVIWECEVMYYSDIDVAKMREDVAPIYASGDIHRVYYGLIKRCIADEDFADKYAL